MNTLRRNLNRNLAIASGVVAIGGGALVGYLKDSPDSLVAQSSTTTEAALVVDEITPVESAARGGFGGSILWVSGMLLAGMARGLKQGDYHK